MITEIDAGHIIYRDLAFMGLERRLKGHLLTGRLDGEHLMTKQSVPDDGLIVIIPKRVSADKKFFNDCSVVVNILLKDINGEANTKLNGLLKKAVEELEADRVGEEDGTWYRYSVSSHGIEEESNMQCHYASINIYFEILNIR